MRHGSGTHQLLQYAACLTNTNSSRPSKHFLTLFLFWLSLLSSKLGTVPAPSHLISLMKSELNKTLKASAFSPASVIGFPGLSIRDPCQATGEIILQQSLSETCSNQPTWTEAKVDSKHILSDLGNVYDKRIRENIDCLFQFFNFFLASRAPSKCKEKERRIFLRAHLFI